MISTGASATSALLFLLVTVANAHPNCGYKPTSCDYDLSLHEPSAICSGAEIVTYGEPCFCKESIPYSIQVPKEVKPKPVESLKSYGYSVITPPSQSPGRRLQLPVKIQTPIPEEKCHDHLSGRSYGFSVQHQPSSPHPRRFSFDCAIQEPVKVQKVVHRPLVPSMSFSIHEVQEQTNLPRYEPLPIAIQTPVHEAPHSIPRLTGLTTKVDRVLVPACEIDGCPDCNDIIQRKSHESCFTPCK